MPPTTLPQLLPEKYLDLVYAAALRQTRHDPHTAADVTQAVFLIMLQKAQAHRLPPEAHMAGWLLKVTHFAVPQVPCADLVSTPSSLDLSNDGLQTQTMATSRLPPPIRRRHHE